MNFSVLMYGLFLGLYVMGKPIPSFVGKYVSKHPIKPPLPHVQHAAIMITRGDVSSPELRQLVLLTLFNNGETK
jgi:hypothetical protein